MPDAEVYLQEVGQDNIMLTEISQWLFLLFRIEKKIGSLSDAFLIYKTQCYESKQELYHHAK
jgi:hypothetical protein